MIRLIRIIRPVWPLFLILLVIAFLLTPGLGSEALWDWDECIYAQYGKEMKATGNFLTNQWNGRLGFEKPPLYAWLLQIPYLFGFNEFTARILSVIGGLALIAVVYIFSKKYFSHTIAIMASLMLLTSEVILIYMTHVNTDIGFSLFIFLGVYCWIISLKKPRFWALAGVFFALAVMIKGLSVLSFLVAIFVSLFINFRREKLINFVKMLGVLLAVIAPWHLYHLLTYGDRFTYVYIYENLIKRANNPIEFHFEGRLFYLKTLYKQMFPWIFFALSLPLIYALQLKKFLNFKNIMKEVKSKEVIYIILLCIVIPLVAMTRVKTRLVWYSVPLYPFLVIFLSYSIETLFTRFKLKKYLVVVIVLIIIEAGGLLFKQTKLLKDKPDRPPRQEIFMKAKRYPQKSIDYLVQFGERRARETLAPNLYTTTTFTYGGHACSLFYSDKKVQYYYSIPEFQKVVKEKAGELYVVENGDLWTIKDLPVKTLYKNIEFTLFKN